MSCLLKVGIDVSCSGRSFMLTRNQASECVSERGKEVCLDIDGKCITEHDGYYYVSAICMSFGVLFLVFYIIPTARKLQGRNNTFCYLRINSGVCLALPVYRWRISPE